MVAFWGSSAELEPASHRGLAAEPLIVVRQVWPVSRHIAYARLLVTVPAVWLAVVPAVADLNESHVFHPSWPGHARFHTVWLISTTSLSSLVAMWLLWRGPWADARASILVAASILAAVLAGFFVATVGRPLYDGTLSDVRPPGATGFDANLVAFSALAIVLLAGAILARRASA